MTMEQIKGCLCIYDERHPDYSYTKQYREQVGEIPKPRDHCHCDNCFEGRDPLAVALIDIYDMREVVPDVV